MRHAVVWPRSPGRLLARVAILTLLLANPARSAQPDAIQKPQPLPELSASQLATSDLRSLAVPLPRADTRAHLVRAPHFQPTPPRESTGVILLKLRGDPLIAAIRVETGTEPRALRLLSERAEVEFAEPDRLQFRCGAPNDPGLPNQWHHARINSHYAWSLGPASNSIRVAIVDTPFQMDHPDLEPNVVPGWDVLTAAPIYSAPGIDHSTLSAGMAAAAVNNGLGVAGAANCKILPINIDGLTSEMCQAVYWAASNNVRIVNISWSGADSQALNEAGRMLTESVGGMLFMSGVNGVGFLDYPQHPFIWCVSMTDAADNMVSKYGDHIDFAAPGWRVYSTSTNGGYRFGDGTSYATPLVAGMAALLMSINPLLPPAEVAEILKRTALDRGEPGWDMWFGWGRVDYGAAASAAQSTLPAITHLERREQTVHLEAKVAPGLNCRLLRAAGELGDWEVLKNVAAQGSGEIRTFTDNAPVPGSAFYRLEAFR